MILKHVKRRKVSIDSHDLHEIHPILQRVYLARGISKLKDTQIKIDNLLPYYSLKNIEQASKLLAECIIDKKKMLIVGDYDADGATSTALCLQVLRSFGGEITYIVPDRIKDGYGLTEKIVESALKFEPYLIITVDNGISSISGVQKARELGIEVLVTDHHLPSKELPNATVIVNPNQPDDNFPSKNLSGVGVIFYVMIATRAYLRKIDWFRNKSIQEPNLSNYLDLVALGTVADVVPLDANNRILVSLGLENIRKGKGSLGIRTLFQIAKRNQQKANTNDLGFVIGPRVNAAGRLDDMTIGIECLIATDESRAYMLATKLDALNNERRQIEKEMEAKALGYLSKIHFEPNAIPHGICLFDYTWHEGVIGILASRIKERFQRPTIIFTKSFDDQLKGSARSITGIHIKDILEKIASENKDLILKFGGHAMAAGLTIEQENLSKFNNLFNQYVLEYSTPEMFNHEIYTDGELNEEDLHLDLVRLLNSAGPWGHCFPEPVFDGDFHVIEIQRIKEKHIKLRVKIGNKTLSGIIFNVGDIIEADFTNRKIHAVFKLDINSFYSEEIQLNFEQFTVL